MTFNFNATESSFRTTMANTSGPKECATCQRHNSLIISCEEQQHSFCLSCVTTCLQSRTAKEDAPNGLVTRLCCPLGDVCGSQLEPYLLQDIIDNITATPQEKNSRNLSQGGLNSPSSCPNEECSYSFQPDEGGFQNLYEWCPKCCEFYCLTCKRRLSSQGYSDHICPVEHDITDTEVSRRLCEVLTEAIWVRCPNNRCKATDRVRSLAVKVTGDCNAIECRVCKRFFCFICSRDLGTRRQDAHKAFPHRNANEADVPRCWLFDDEVCGNHEGRALLIRQMSAVTRYLHSLQMSNERKLSLLNKNKELLGEVFTFLTKKNPFKSVPDKCVIM